MLLNLWLIISKKCKPLLLQEDPLLAKRASQSLIPKSNIMKSLKNNSLALDSQIYLPSRQMLFRVLLQNMENLSLLEDNLYNESFGQMERYRQVYFVSAENQKKVVQ